MSSIRIILALIIASALQTSSSPATKDFNKVTDETKATNDTVSSPGQDTKRFLRVAVGFEAISENTAEERAGVTEPPSAWKSMAEKLSKHFKAFVKKIKNLFRQMTGKGVRPPKANGKAALKPVANSENIPIVHDTDGNLAKLKDQETEHGKPWWVSKYISDLQEEELALRQQRVEFKSDKERKGYLRIIYPSEEDDLLLMLTNW